MSSQLQTESPDESFPRAGSPRARNSFGDLFSVQSLDDSSDEIDAAVARNDFRTVDRLLDAQLSEVMQGLVIEDFNSGQTGSLATPRMLAANQEANLGAVALQIARRTMEMDSVLKKHGWGEIQAFGDDVVRQYKARNGADRVTPRPGMSPDEMVELSLQFEPVQVDPNMVAEYRQRLAQLDTELRKFGSSVWTDPRTARIANVLASSAELGRPGLLQDREQNINDYLDPFTKHVGLPLVEGLDAFVGGAAEIGIGARSVLHDLGVVALDGFTQGNKDAYYQQPTSWVQDRDGSWYHNGGKVGSAEVFAGVWYSLTGEMIDQQLARVADTKAQAVMQATGVQNLSIGLGTFMGSMGVFMGSGAPAMKAGSLLTKGLAVATTGGHAAKSIGRTEKVVRLLASRSGPAAALGTLEAVKGGRIEGYGNAMLHGTVMAVPLMVMGAIGDRLERTLLRYSHLPKPIARTLAGTVEGMGLDLGTWEAGWQFVKDPSDRTWSELTQQVMVNAIGNGILRGTGVMSAGAHEASLPPGEVRARREARRTEAMREEPEAVAAARGTEVEPVRDLGAAAGEARATAGMQPEASMQATARAEQAEATLDRQEAGVAKTEQEKLEARYATREELQELKRQPPSPERTQKIIKLLNQSRLAFGKDFAGFVKKNAEVAEEGMKADIEAGKEIAEAGDVVKALLGEKHASDYKAARKRALAEIQGAREAAVEQRLAAKQEGMRGDSGKVTVEQVPAAEPGLLPKRAGVAPSPERQMIQEGGREGLEEVHWRELAEENVPRGTSAEPQRAEARAPAEPSPGTPASLRMRPSLETEGVAGTEPIRARDVLREMEGFDGDPVRVPIRKGVGMRGVRSTRGILGWYATHEHLVRLKGARNVVVAAHEWAHGMDLTVHASRHLLKGLNPVQQLGLKRAAHPYYPGYEKLSRVSQRMESWAEFWARHLLDDPTLKEETGAFHDWAMAWISNPKQARLLGQMQRIQSALRRYRDQGSVQRVRQTWVAEYDKESLQELKAQGIMKDTPPARAVGFFRKVWNSFIKTMVDDVQPLKGAQFRSLANVHGKELARRIEENLDITSNPTRLMDVYRMTASKQAEAFLAVGTHDLAGNQTGESLRQIFEDIGGDRYEDFITYLIAKRSLEARDKGLDTQLERDDYLTAVEKLENPDFIKGAERIRAWSDRLIDYAVEGGLFSPEQAASIKGSYKTYIPFQRVLEGPAMHAPGRGVAERGTGVKRMKGGQEEIRDPVNALGDMARSIITKTQQAMVMKSMVKFGIVNPKVGSFVTEVPRKNIPKDHPMAQIAEAILRAAKPTSDEADFEIQKLAKTLEDLSAAGELGPSITLFGQQTIPQGSRPIIAYTPHFTEAELSRMSDFQRRLAEDKNGKLIWLEVDKDAYEVLMGIDTPQTILDKAPAFVQAAIYKPAELLRFGATVASPGFAVRNMIRDAVADTVYTSDRNKAWLFSGFGRLAKGLVMKGSDAAEIFDALGGGVSTFFAGEVAAGRTARELLKLNRGWRGHVASAIHGYTDQLAKWTEQPLRTEAFARTRERALMEGKSELEANLEALEAAKEITINFTRGGTISRALNRLVPYLNAGIQGNRKFFMTLAGKNGDVAQKAAWTRALVNLTVPTLALWWLNHDEEWYQELPEWRRLNYWNFKMPGTDEIVSMPKPFEMGKIFGNVPELMMDQAMSTHPMAVQDVALDAIGATLPQWPIPAFMRPVLEVAANHDFFTNRQIVPEWLQRSRMPKDQVTAYTRWFGKTGAAIARSFGFDPSPMVVEHFLDAMTGGMAGRLSDAVTSVGGATTMFEGEGMRDVPVVGTLFRQGAFEQSRSVQQVFDLDTEFTQLAGSDMLTNRQKIERRLISRAKEDISNLKKQAREGKIGRSAANEEAAEIARKVLSRIQK